MKSFSIIQLSQSLLGVAGVDIPISSFDHALPDSQLGFGGHKMVVMGGTGNLVLHSRLETQNSYVEVSPGLFTRFLVIQFQCFTRIH